MVRRMKKVLRYIDKRILEEYKEIQRLEDDVIIYRNVVDTDYNTSYIGKCSKCTRVVYLEHPVAVGVVCTIRCIGCVPKKCEVCSVYHVEEGVDEWKEARKEEKRKNRRKNRRTNG